MGGSRTKKSAINVTTGLIYQLVNILLSFILRRVFVVYLGNELVGVNSLLTNIASMLNLADLGIGSAIFVALYKPIAEKNREQVIAISQLCAKVYKFIALFILSLGVVITPFLGLFIGKKDLETMDLGFVQMAFLILLVNTAISYLFSYKWVLFNADQNSHIVSIAQTAYIIFAVIAQIVVIILFKDYLLALAIKAGLLFVQNVVLSRIAASRYPYLREKKKHKLDETVKNGILTNTRALAFHRIGNYVVNSTDNIIITRFINLNKAGFYNNYYMIISAVSLLIAEFSNGITASLGNLLVTDSEKAHPVFKKVFFINYVFFNFATTSLLVLLSPFVKLWLSEIQLLQFDTVLVLTINFFIIGVMSPLGSLRASAGLFKPDRYLHIFYALLNLVLSVLLVRAIGITGVFIGTMVCYILKEILVMPQIVCRMILHISPKRFYQTFIKYVLVTVCGAGLTYVITTQVQLSGRILDFLLKCVFCLIIPNLLLVSAFHKTEEFKYFWQLIKDALQKLKGFIQKRRTGKA